MEDGASAFFRDIVEPTVAEFLAGAGDQRRGCLACLCLASMVDHYFHARPEFRQGCRTVQAFSRNIASANWAVGQVIGVANATKHFARTEDRVGYEDIKTRPIAFGNARCGWPINGAYVMLQDPEGKVWLLSHLAEAALEFWRNRLTL